MSIYAIDVDIDGDIDIVTASIWDGKIYWYENNGHQIFQTHTISTTAAAANSVFADGKDKLCILKLPNGSYRNSPEIIIAFNSNQQ